MSFLIRRNLPWAWAGWVDDFNRPPENPIKQPWGHFGDGSRAVLNSANEMHMPANYSSTIGGGESYEFQPFTPNFAMEWEMWWPVEGLAAQYFNLCIMENWAKVGPSFADSVLIRCRHAPVVGADDVHIIEFDGLMSSGNDLAGASSPVPYYGNSVTLKVLIDNDALCRVYINGLARCQAQLTPSHRPHPGKRGLNFFNNALCDAWIRWAKIYDRPTDFPLSSLWVNSFYDDFNRTPGAVGNGWTQVGANAAIANNSWSATGTSNSSTGLIRDTGITGGSQRIEAIAGGNNAPNASADSSLILRCNAAGTEGLAANFFSGHIYLSRWTGSLSSPTFADFVHTPATIAAGDKLQFSTVGDYAWIEVNDVLVCQAQLFGAVSSSNSWAGLRVERSGSNSHSWNDARILAGP